MHWQPLRDDTSEAILAYDRHLGRPITTPTAAVISKTCAINIRSFHEEIECGKEHALELHIALSSALPGRGHGDGNPSGKQFIVGFDRLLATVEGGWR